MTEAKDCELSWMSDFGKMEILLYSHIISPVLLLDFLMMLPRRDERFQQAGITDIVQISSRFNIKLITQSDRQDVYYDVRVFKSQDVVSSDRLGIEFL